ncbi:hypothetical protein DTO045G8_7647 [Paecilomyces variotii]|nr:hypothetical protein DTO045G8_7647 [Paecilomyces variotii]
MIHKTDERSATMQQTFSEKTCYERGWLHSEPLDADAIDIVCVFPTRLNAKYVEHYLTASSVPFPIQRYPTIEDLAEAEVLGFSSNVSSVQGGELPGWDDDYKRSAWYGQAYHRLTQGSSLPGDDGYSWFAGFLWKEHRLYGKLMCIPETKVASILRDAYDLAGYWKNEWLGDGDGRIDFRLADVAWGIELLRDGDRLHAHCSRFVNNGSYTPWIQKGWLRNWLIIDCRTSPPRPYNVPGTKLWRAVFAETFRLWKS